MDKNPRYKIKKTIEKLIYQDVEEPEYTYSEAKPDEEVPFVYHTVYFDKNGILRKRVIRDSDDFIIVANVYDDQSNEVYSCGCRQSNHNWNILYLYQSFGIQPNRPPRTLRIDLTNDPPTISEE